MAKSPVSSKDGEAAAPAPQSQAQARPQVRGSGEAQPAPNAPQPQQTQQPQLSILTQFLRDLSFESPNAPGALQSPGGNPKLQMNINVQATKRGDDIYEVVLNFDARANSDLGVIYNVELVYGGMFRLANIPENVLQPVLFVDCPTLLFPYMRRIVSQLAQDGGFPPLMLDPIDFAALYRRNLQQQQEQGQGQAPASGGSGTA